jgi:hypothetical protein
MKLFALLTLATGLSLASSAPSDTPRPEGDKPPAALEMATRPVEVRFANGSTVLMSLLQDNIEIVTEFGKLKIPPTEIRYIDFGVHLSEAVRPVIERALEQLSSSNYKEREVAMKQLVDLGPQAYLALYQTTRSKDQEAAKRAQLAMKAIADKVPSRLLRLREEDRIRTTKFTVVGRVITPAIKARAEYFGDLSLRPNQLLTIRWLEGTGSNEITIDAAKYGAAAEQWMDTGIRLEPHLKVKITASGQVDIAPQQGGQYISGPGGLGPEVGLPIRAGLRGQTVRCGALIGRIGEGGTPFVIGEMFHQAPSAEGKLYLHIQPGPWGGVPNGSYRVRIATGPAADDND